MKRLIASFVVAAGCLLSGCGPAQWNHYAEYLPAPTWSGEQLEQASIREFIADLPPGHALEPDTATLRSKVDAAPVERRGDTSWLTLASTNAVPERAFHLNHRTKTLGMVVKTPAASDAAPVHFFQRTKSDWYHWIDDKEQAKALTGR